MKGGKTPLGYTIVEVMIVLAVSGVMFLIAANFINGKQEHTAFTEGSNDLVSRLQNIAQDVTDGHYSDWPITCDANPSGTAISFPASGSPGQGANPKCVFLGKLVHFYISGTALPQAYETFSLAAARNITGSLPQPGVKAIPGLTDQSTVPQNLYVQGMHVLDLTGNDHPSVSNIGFAQGLGTIPDPTAGVYQSGAQTVGLVYTTALDNAAAGSVTAIAGGAVQPAKSAVICLSDGTRYAQVFIGGTNGSAPSSNNGNQLNVSVQQLGTVACS